MFVPAKKLLGPDGTVGVGATEGAIVGVGAAVGLTVGCGVAPTMVGVGVGAMVGALVGNGAGWVGSGLSLHSLSSGPPTR